jgi:hypothetical protein
MAALIVPIAVEQGIDFNNTFAFANPDPAGSNDWSKLTYPDYTGWQARLQVRQFFDPASVQLLALTTGSGLTFSTVSFVGAPVATGLNAIAVAITATQTVGLTAGTFYYDLFFDSPSGTHFRQMTGPFDVDLTVVR